MGNSCFSTDSGYAVVGRKRREPEITNLDGSARTPLDGVVPPPGGGGSYRKTVTSAKYEAPQDVNKNTKQRDSGEPELNFTLQEPVMDNSEVRTFFDDSRQDSPGQGSRHTGSASGMSTGMKTGTGSGSNTHVEVFSLSKSNVSTPPKNDTVHSSVTTEGTTNGTPHGTTHVEVFSLNLNEDRHMAHTSGQTEHDHSPPTETVHINMTAFLGQESPRRTEVATGSDNLSFISVLSSPTPSNKQSVIVPVMGTTISSNTETTISSNITNNQSPMVGVVNTSFISDEAEDMGSPYSGSGPNRALVSDLVEDLDSDRPDENCFFFGMESLQFVSKKSRENVAYDGSEADREIAEIMADIDTIEDGVWLRLKPPVDDTDSVHDVDITNDTPGTTDHMPYEDVLDQLRNVCVKVEDLLRRRGVDNTDDVDTDWLKLPDLTTIDQKYQKKTSDAQTETMGRLMIAAKQNDEQMAKDVLDNYKRQQEKLLRMRDIERRKLLDRLKLKMKTKNQGDHCGIRDEEQDDEQTLRAQYGKLIVDDDDSEEEILVGDDISSDYSDSSDQSALSYTDEDESSIDDNPDANNVLKSTLTQDIQSRMKEMTSSDFQSIMGIYRKERSSIRTLKESERNRLNQSLWEKMAERRKHVDDSIYEGEEDTESQTPHDPSHIELINRSTGPDIAKTGSADDTSKTVACGHVTSTRDASTEATIGVQSLLSDDDNISTEITEKELDTLNEGLLYRTMEKGVIDQQDVDDLMQEHFNNVRKMRQAKELAASVQRQKLLDKLRSLKTTTETDVDLEILEKDIKQEYNKLSKEEELVERDCVKTLHERQAVTQEDLAEVLNRYKQSQDSLNQQRIRQRELLNERLNDKLSGRKGTGKADGQAENSDIDRQQAAEKQHTQAEQTIAEMDEAFYKSLLDRKSAGEISELATLLDQHIDKVDQFRRDVRKQLNQRRRERRRHDTAEQASALVEDNEQKREQLRKLRRDERDKMDDKLKEKLRKRKQKRQLGEDDDNAPGLPPKKPERKRKSHKSKKTNVQDSTRSAYENVNIAQ